MATRKTTPAAAAKKPVAAKKAAAKKATAKEVPEKKAPEKKVTAKKVAAKKASAKKAPAAKKTAAAKKAAPRPRAAAIDPAAQLDKLTPDAPLPRGNARGTARGTEASGAQMPADFFAGYTGEVLAADAFAQAAAALGCEVAAVRAVAEVESRGSGFDAKQRPTILYERHVFARNTTPKGRFNAEHPDISANVPYAKGTFGNTEAQWTKLAAAYALDPEAALKAPSWGIFQILGENHKACGYASATDYARAMVTSPVEHLRAFVHFVASDRRLLKAIRERDWAGFALAYNGKNYATYQYDTKIAAAYARHAAG